jgi:hypothetical protein
MAKLTINEAVQGYTHKIAFDYVDLQTTGFLQNLGAAGQKVVGSMAPGDIIDLAVIYQVVDPAGATDIVLDFGNQTNDPDEIIDAADVDGLTKVVYNTGDEFVTNAKMSVVNDTTAAKTLYMEVNGTVTALTAGSWVLAWRQNVCPQV